MATGDLEERKRAVRLTGGALRALADAGLRFGPLSPMTLLVAGGVADTDGLTAELDRLEGEWEWLVPALCDPRCSVIMLAGSEDAAFYGSYLFPDAGAAGPGFMCVPDAGGMRLEGPYSMGEARFALYGILAPDGMSEAESARITLTPERFLATIAMLDAWRTSWMAARALRRGGVPPGVGVRDVIEAWETGAALPHPGWLVYVAGALAGSSIPPGFGKKIPAVLDGMKKEGLLEAAGGAAAGTGEFLAPGPLLTAMFLATGGPVTCFGLSVQKLGGGGEVSAAGLLGMRTGAGMFMADLHGLQSGEVDLVMAGPYASMELLAMAMPEEEPPETFSMDTPFTRDAVLAKVREAPAAAPSVAAECCPFCGEEVKDRAKFCQQCGRELPEEGRAAFCYKCGAELKEGAQFCRKCGART
ncbi:MAG: zinc ribbon domain-containing protein [Actinobacteria bacterium]|nr:zinc ribbon domain-containing protein [Actinomycetota bacterium]MBU1944632.1 zinc ribbon domain-containing protein [Actinomycetota bacterium]